MSYVATALLSRVPASVYVIIAVLCMGAALWIGVRPRALPLVVLLSIASLGVAAVCLLLVLHDMIVEPPVPPPPVVSGALISAQLAAQSRLLAILPAVIGLMGGGVVFGMGGGVAWIYYRIRWRLHTLQRMRSASGRHRVAIRGLGLAMLSGLSMECVALGIVISSIPPLAVGPVPSRLPWNASERTAVIAFIVGLALGLVAVASSLSRYSSHIGHRGLVSIVGVRLTSGLLLVGVTSSLLGLALTSAQMVPGRDVVVYAVSYSSTGGFLYALRGTDGRPLWRFALRDYQTSTPVQSGHALYISVSNGQPNADDVYALQADTGKVLWRFQTHALSDTETSMPVVVGGRVYVTAARYRAGGTVEQHLYALDATDGSLLWDATAAVQSNGADVSSLPVVAGNFAYVAVYNAVMHDDNQEKAQDSEFVAVHLNDGSPAWRFRSAIAGGPYTYAVADGMVFLASPTLTAVGAAQRRSDAKLGHLYALRASDGMEVWSSEIASGAQLVGAAKDTLCLTTDTGVYGVGASDGRVRWHRPDAHTMGIHSGVAYVVSNSSVPYQFRLGAVRIADGAALWSEQPMTYVASSFGGEPWLAAADDAIYVAYGTTVYAWRAADGQLLWSSAVGGGGPPQNGFLSAPAIAAGALYVGSQGAGYYALRTFDGSAFWRFNAPSVWLPAVGHT